MILSDFHLHSSHSEDSEAPMEQQIEAGINAGLKYMCFTEHMDRDWPEEAVPPGTEHTKSEVENNAFEVDTDAYYSHLLECREKYGDRIDIRFGVEYGFQPHLVKDNLEYVNAYPFDFVIGSQHLMDGLDVYYAESFAGMSEKDAYRRYFECILESICIFDGYDIFGHLDYIVRYGPNKNKYFSYKDHDGVLDEVLRQLIKRGKGIEINTAGYRKLGNEPNPGTEILRRYHELGGEIITVGSDAHSPENVAHDFDRAEALLKELGFGYYCIFKDRKPEFLRI